MRYVFDCGCFYNSCITQGRYPENKGIMRDFQYTIFALEVQRLYS
jgi:hypothetical protein